MNFLSKVIKIYFASSRRNDFAGANNYYDLWVFDEFHEQEQGEQEGQTWERRGGSTTEGSAFVNNLLKVLDGQECRLDSKYSRVFKKKKNVPIIMIANKLPQIMERHGPFRARFFRIRFSNQIKNLEEERIIATLWGCLLRRAIKSPYAKERETPKEVTLAYNGSSALIILVPVKEQEEKKGEETLINQVNEWEQAIQKVENPIGERKEKTQIEKIMKKQPILITKEGEFYKIKPKIINIKKGYNILIFEILKIEEQPGEENKNKINLLNFANIPIKKREEENEKEKSPFKKMFDQLEKKINGHEEERKESTEEGERESITRLSSIFLDNKEREWIRRERLSQKTSIKEGWVKNEEVWSVISLQRAKSEQEDDYATWPLEIKIFGGEKKENENHRERKIFPAILRNIRRGEEEEREILRMYEKEKRLIENYEGSEGIRAIKCEISLARNGEKQPWNTEC